MHNHRQEPLQLHSGQNIGVLEVVTLADAPPMASQPGPPRRPSLPEHLSPLQQQQLNALFQEFSDVFSQGEDDLGSTPLLEHTFETHGPSLRQPYQRQSPAVRREEMAQVQQMLASNVIRPSNSPWASPVVMVRKKDGSLRFCVDFRQLNAATVKDAHPLPSLPEHLSPLQQQQLNALFQEFSDVFSQGEDDLGSTPLLEHTIETHGPSLQQPYRRQSPAVRLEEMVQVQQMLASNVIRPSNSPWASPVVMVRKKDGSLRFCVDFRQLNTATVKDAHPLPRIDDLLDALHGAKWFSNLDLKSGYWQVPITEQDKAKTAFRTSGGQLYEFNQVPFGLCNAPATFSRLVDRVLAGLHWETCLFYLDDIIVFSSTWEEHLARLCQVFERLRHTNLKLGADKCTFAAKEVSNLGHQATEEGLLPDSLLLAAIREIPPPKTATEVRSFLGLAGYYRRYVKGFAAIAGTLHALTRKDAVFHWSAKCQAAFDQLKHLLTTSPITAFPDFSQAFRLYTDASTAGLGAILAQVRDGKERIICCAS